MSSPSAPRARDLRPDPDLRARLEEEAAWLDRVAEILHSAADVAQDHGCRTSGGGRLDHAIERVIDDIDARLRQLRDVAGPGEDRSGAWTESLGGVVVHIGLALAALAAWGWL
jgi:hypothetical protein